MQPSDSSFPLEKRTHFIINTAWLNRISYLYLVFPFFIFCLTWLRFSVGLIGALFILFTLWLSWREFRKAEEPLLLSIKQTTLAFIMIFTWVALSGIGGYAFQNRDLYWRNAILHDLINYSWPVIYSTPANYNHMLVYYIGYWLPAAVSGKVFGWDTANAVLFIWTFIGIALTTLHLATRKRFSPLFSILLLIFFSGMDMVGVTLIAKASYPILIPPIQHLDAWADTLQYSSFTTQLFWVYNQAVPCWLCTIMIINHEERRRQFLLWALCFFLAPLTAIGLFPLVLIEAFEQSLTEWRLLSKQDAFQRLAKTVADIFSPANVFGGGFVLTISYFYFSTNTATRNRSFQFLDIWNALIFFIIEVGILWLLVAPEHKTDLHLYAIGGMLLLFPFIKFGNGHDFVMRASIAPLFVLMVWCGETLINKDTQTIKKYLLITCLLIGSLTPIYEINRSIFRTASFYLSSPQPPPASSPDIQPVTHLTFHGGPETDHPGTLSANSLQTLGYLEDAISKNFLGKIERSLFYKYLSRH